MRLILIALTTAILPFGCSGTTDPPALAPQEPFTPRPLPPPEPEAALGFAAEIYGSPWKAKEITVTKRDSNTIEISGVSEDTWAGHTVTLRIVEAWQHGEYLLSADGNGSVFSIAIGPYVWNTQVWQGTSRAVVTHVSENRIAGTFEGNAFNAFGGELLTIRLGWFNVRF